jgi:tetratricopeptide (TPR) repeat protein
MTRRGADRTLRSKTVEPPPGPTSRWPPWAPAALLALLTLLAYLPALRGGFIWDDNAYVTENVTLRSAAGLGRIWAEPGALPQYYPLTFTTFWLEYHVWGLSPFGYHLVNVALHAASALLLWRVLLFLEVPAAWLAAAVFAVHPVHVESVAWITERKNTLSGVCYLGALLAYLHFALAAAPRPRWRLYGLALALFAAALLSKTVTASLPAVLLVILWWKRPRLDAAALAPLAPMVALGLGAGLVTAWLEKQHVGAVGADWNLSIVERGLIAGRALWFYAATLAWPHPLVFFYPRWRIDAGAWWQYVFPLAALAVVAALVALRQRLGRGPLVGVLCFAVTLAPALGFVDVFPMRYSFVADHFQYLASIALIVLAVAALSTALRRLPVPAARVGVGAAALALFGALTWRQASTYRDLETLWRDTIAANPAAWMAHNNLGLLLFERGRAAEAMAHYRAALAAKPDDAFAHNNLGRALAAQGSMDEAIEQFHAALRIEPGNAEARSNLGNALAAQGRLDEAAAQYRVALEIRPRYADAHNNLANVLAMLGRTDEAVQHYRAALAIDPGYRDARANLETILGAPAPEP